MDLVFPPFCVGCGEKFNIFSRDYNEKAVLCPSCMAEWEKAKLSPCPVCKIASIDCACVPELLTGTEIVSLAKFGTSREVDRIVYTLKRRKIQRLFDFVSLSLARRLIAFSRESGISLSEMVITYAPRKPRSVVLYGLDHAEMLACGVAENLKLPMIHALIRKRGGKDQKKLTARKRFENSSNRFLLRESAANWIKDKTVIFVDDIVTTGATSAACVDVLRKGSPRKIVVLCIARSTIKKKKKRRKK